AEQRGFVHALAGQRLASLRKINVACEIGKTDGLTDVSACVKQRLAQFAEAEAAAKSFDFFSLRIGVAICHAPDSLGRDFFCNWLFHLNYDEAPVATIIFIGAENRMGSCP